MSDAQLNKAKPSARKSFGAYKPIVVFPNGRTLVVEQSPDRFDRNTKAGMVSGDKFARGNTYSTRDEAIAAAQEYINRQAAAVKRHIEKYGAEKRLLAELELWTGKVAL